MTSYNQGYTNLKQLLPSYMYNLTVKLYSKTRVWWYTGTKFVCPCCNGHFRSFLPFGLRPRTNVMCPQCLSLERHRLLNCYLIDQTNLFETSSLLTILHVAPERILQKKLCAAPNVNYVSIDLASPLAQLHMDITDLQFDDCTFDVILCLHVLEHVPNDRVAIRELYRVLKPGGWAILQSPIDFSKAETFEDATITTPEGRLLAFGQDDHVRIYGRDYQERLKEAGFEILVDDYVRHLPTTTIERYRLPIEDIYLCKKS